jgi:hypothetical protein
MRSKRMRGYGSWCIGWNESNRNETPSSNNSGCLWILIGLGVLFFISSLKVTMETGNLFSICIGIAVLCGIIKGLNDLN